MYACKNSVWFVKLLTARKPLLSGNQCTAARLKRVFVKIGFSSFFATSYKGKLDHSHDIAFPLIVKPCSEDGSIGIDMGSVVGSVKELMERIHYIHEEFDGPALIEEYIEGRELYAAVLGNDSPEVLPLIELDLS